jgi:hypothetical protein
VRAERPPWASAEPDASSFRNPGVHGRAGEPGDRLRTEVGIDGQLDVLPVGGQRGGAVPLSLHPLGEEHTIRLFKRIPGWTTPRIRCPAAADRWTWLTVAAYTQRRLASPLAAGRRPTR